MTRGAIIRLGAAGAVALVIYAGSIAVAGSRTQEIPDQPPAVDVEERKAAEGVDESDPEPTQEELAAARAAGEAELAIVEANSYRRIHQDVLESGIEVQLPGRLGAAVEADLVSRLSASDRILTWTQTKQAGATTIERAHFTNGESLLMLTWQSWPANASAQVMVRDDTKVEYHGNVDVLIRDHTYEGRFEVTAVGGGVLARVLAANTYDVSVADAVDMALKLHEDLLFDLTRSP